MSQFKILSSEEQLAAKARLDEGDESARMELFESVLGVAYKTASQFCGRSSLDLDDLQSEASLILWQNISKWDPALGSLTTFTQISVSNHLKDQTRDTGHTIRITKWGLKKGAKKKVVSLNEVENTVRGEPVQKDKNDQADIERVKWRLQTIYFALFKNPKERQILSMYWAFGKYRNKRTNAQIAAEVGSTEEQVKEFLASAQRSVKIFVGKNKGQYLSRCHGCRKPCLTDQSGLVYCTPACRGRHQIVKRRCQYCKEQFEKKRHSRRVFCSRRCANLGSVKVMCYRRCALATCDKSFPVTRHCIGQQFCSETCRKQDVENDRLPVGTERKCHRPSCEVRFVIQGRSPEQRYCSRTCREESVREQATTMVPQKPRKCKRPSCTVRFMVRDSSPRQYCTNKCHKQHVSEKTFPEITCGNKACGKRFRPKDNARGKFCSRPCFFAVLRTGGRQAVAAIEEREAS